MSEDYYEKGKQDARGYYGSQAFAGYTRDVSAESAIKLFLPPVHETGMQMAVPLPKPRQDWTNGFKEQQAAILAL